MVTEREGIADFFVIVEERSKNVVKLIESDPKLPESMSKLFLEQATDFLPDDVEKVKFDPRFTCEDDHVFELPNYELPEPYLFAVKNPDSLAKFVLDPAKPPRIKGVFGAAFDRSTGKVRAYFQRSSQTKILRGGWNIFFRDGIFQKIEDPGLTLESSLVAVYEGNSLFFRKFPLVNPILELKDLFFASTEEEVKQTLEHPLFFPDDTEILSKHFDMTMRKRIAYVRESKILDMVSAQKVCSGLKRFFNDIQITYRTPPGGDGKIKLPTTKKDLKRLFNFLCDSYYVSELTDRKYESTSHKSIG